ncbi:protein ninH [Pragia fontium]|uniref:protein ninH n=1 Tax=Pragia fontium TaxID=82985 RepID=UPI000F6BE73E|nr:protein ninH [Pragia fontium]VEJ54607.1 Phage NinH protein [Pragia fontium]
MDIQISTIPDLLVKTRGNQSAVANILSVQRYTVKKYSRDFKAEGHAVINGRLMVKTSGKRRKDKAAA